MHRPARSLVLALIAVATALGACAEGEEPSRVGRRTPSSGSSPESASVCERACARVYDTCHRVLSDSAGVLNRARCVSECGRGTLNNAELCLTTVACTVPAITACFESAPVGDSGAGPRDSGVVIADSGVAIADSGVGPRTDASVPPVDSGAAPPSCSSACGRIYDGCAVSLTIDGATITRAQCETHCAATASYRNSVGCLSSMACTMDAFYSCLAGR
jgi:hypothetical protein